MRSFGTNVPKPHKKPQTHSRRTVERNRHFLGIFGFLSEASIFGSPKLLNAISRTQELGEPIWATPAIVGGQIIVRSKKHLWLFAEPGPKLEIISFSTRSDPMTPIASKTYAAQFQV